MALSNPRAIYGVHSVTPYNRSTGLPYGTAKVVGEASVNMSGELNKLMGGASRFPWAVEDGAISSEISLKLKELPNWMFELFAGKAPTTANSDSSGTVSTLTNKYGTSVMNSSTGIASVTVKAAEKADLKFTKYVVKAVSSTTVDVYAMTDEDFNRGVDKTFVNDALKITSSALTITASTAVEIPDFGLELTGGSGTIGMTTGDTATFEVLPPSSESTSVTVGGSSDSYPEFGLILMAQQRSNGEMFEIDVFRAKGIGLPIAFSEKAWSEAEIKLEAFFDSAQGGVFKMRHIIPS
jgi:hypothetical protein